MSQGRSEIARTIETELRKARTLVDLMSHIDLGNPPVKAHSWRRCLWLERPSITRVNCWTGPNTSRHISVDMPVQPS